MRMWVAGCNPFWGTIHGDSTKSCLKANSNRNVKTITHVSICKKEELQMLELVKDELRTVIQVRADTQPECFQIMCFELIGASHARPLSLGLSLAFDA